MTYQQQHTSVLQIFLQTLLFGGIWLVIPLIYNDLSFASHDLKKGVQNLVGVGIIITLNVRWLLPNFYFDNKKTAYVLLSMLVVAVTYLVVSYFVSEILPFETTPHKSRRGGHSATFQVVKQINRLMPYVLALVGSALFEISRFANLQLKRAGQLRNEKLQAEMKLLKSQINPHFLFNALNNVYSLSYLKPAETPKNLLKLSNMLRYMLYECNVERVALEKEIAYLQNFINLQLLKDSRGMNVEVDLEVTHPQLLIAPMLLIPFVENAFKHSHIEDLKNGWITIQLTTTNNQIHLVVANSIPQTKNPQDKVGGIGLPTTQRLLELHYPQQHQLNITTSSTEYRVDLKITVT